MDIAAERPVSANKITISHQKINPHSIMSNRGSNLIKKKDLADSGYRHTEVILKSTEKMHDVRGNDLHDDGFAYKTTTNHLK